MDQTSPAFSGPELSALEAHQVVALLKRGEVSPTNLLDVSFARIEAVEPAINAMPTLCPDRAYAAAKSIDPKKALLGGLPLGIKDLDRVAGVRTTFATSGFADFVPDVSEHFVERLETNGGIVVGKTNTPEFGAGGNTFNDVFGTTRNPWNIALNPAGSSGGAAASLATGQTWLSQGSDHGGSLRTPAAYCGVVGLRTVPGRISSRLTPGRSAGFLDGGVIGPMARSVRDAALFLDAMIGFEPADPASLPATARSFEDAVLHVDQKTRIASAPDLGGFGAVERPIREAMQKALTKVAAAGATVVEDCPDLTGLEETYRRLRGFGMAASLPQIPDEIRRHVKDTLRQNWREAQQLTLDDFSRLNIDRTRLFLEMQNFLGDFDVLATATVGAMPRPVEIEWINQIEDQTYHDYLGWLRFAFLATTTGLPAVSVPIGVSADGLPIGLQLIGPPRGEAKVLAAARAVEIAVGGPVGPIDPVRL